MNSTTKNCLDRFLDTLVSRFGMERQELDNIWEETQKKTKKTKTKRIPSAYILFCRDERPKLQDMRFGEAAKELGRRWRQATPEVREHYEEQRGNLIRQTWPAEPTPEPEPEETTVESSAREDEETMKPKKAQKSRKVEIPDAITDARERDHWPGFAQLTMAELRHHCERNNLKKSKNRNDMVHALVVHVIALQNQD